MITDKLYDAIRAIILQFGATESILDELSQRIADPSEEFTVVLKLAALRTAVAAFDRLDRRLQERRTLVPEGENVLNARD